VSSSVNSVYRDFAESIAKFEKFDRIDMDIPSIWMHDGSKLYLRAYPDARRVGNVWEGVPSTLDTDIVDGDLHIKMDNNCFYSCGTVTTVYIPGGSEKYVINDRLEISQSNTIISVKGIIKAKTNLVLIDNNTVDFVYSGETKLMVDRELKRLGLTGIRYNVLRQYTYSMPNGVTGSLFPYTETSNIFINKIKLAQFVVPDIDQTSRFRNNYVLIDDDDVLDNLNQLSSRVDEPEQYSEIGSERLKVPVDRELAFNIRSLALYRKRADFTSICNFNNRRVVLAGKLNRIRMGMSAYVKNGRFICGESEMSDDAVW